jgi:hypothetical protein
MDDAQRGDVYRLSNGHLFRVITQTQIANFDGDRVNAVWGLEIVPEGKDSPASIGRVGAGEHQRTFTVDGCYRSFGSIMLYATRKEAAVRTRR